MTTIYNYIMRKINEFEDYLLEPKQQETVTLKPKQDLKDFKIGLLNLLKPKDGYEQQLEELKQKLLSDKPSKLAECKQKPINQQIKELREQLSK